MADFKKKPKTRFKHVAKLSLKEAREEVDALREGIAYHDRLYYVKDSPAISDAVYDRLFRRLQELEAAFPKLRAAESPTRRVGGAAGAELAKVRHTAPMLSLDAVLEQSGVERFYASVARAAGDGKPIFVAEPKFDGLSVEVVYRGGAFERGSTRGDGTTGEDVSENLETVRTIPRRLRGRRVPELLAVRGEVYLPLAAFQKLNKERIERGEEPFANPRNAAAGTVRRLDPRVVARTPLDVTFYDVLEIEGDEPTSHWQTLSRLAGWGLKTDSHARRCKSVADIARFREDLSQERDELAYEIDGVVVKVDDLALREKLGVRHRSPRWALAWKFEPRQEVTTLEDIVVQVGMTGMLTPVALLSPVDVGGVTVSRATLHNEGDVRRKGLHVGDRVRIARAGDVIPEVVERVAPKRRKTTRAFRMPRKCPSCGTKVEQEGAYWFCPAGLACRAQLVGHVTHYGSRRALDIEGLGEKTARQLVDARLVETLADLYALTADDLLGLEGFAEKSARALHRAIQGTREPALDRYLYALGIRHVGERIARSLADALGSLEALASATEQELRAVPDVGERIAHGVHGFFADRENRRVLARMKKLGVKVRSAGKGRRAGGKGNDKSESRGGPLAGKTFVFTGTLSRWTRPEAERLVEDLGARAASSVTGKTDYVVAGEEPGGKLERAEQLGLEILDERGFARMVKRRRARTRTSSRA